MLFMVKIVVRLPGDWPKEKLAETNKNETARSMQFVKEGKLKRIFRIVGQRANFSIWEAGSLEELHAVTDMRTGRKHVLSILVENKSGVLTRIAGLFARRGFNISTLTVGPTEDVQISRVTLTVDGALHPIDQVTKQLHKLINVLKIRDLEPADTVARELALFKVTADGVQRGELMQIAEIFRGKVVDVTKRAIIIEVTGTTDKIEAFETMVRPFGLIEMMRTGEIAISRGRSET